MSSSDTCIADCANEFKFSCFVEYVLVATENQETLQNLSKDINWWPYTEICSVCEVNYDFIGHVEGFQDDLQLLLDKFPDNNALIELYEQKKKKIVERIVKEPRKMYIWSTSINLQNQPY